MLNLPLHVQFCVMLVLSSWIVKLAIFLSADWAVNRNMLDCSITWEANWEHFPLRLQSMYSLKCLSILTVTKIGDCDLWRRARLQIKKKQESFDPWHSPPCFCCQIEAQRRLNVCFPPLQGSSHCLWSSAQILLDEAWRTETITLVWRGRVESWHVTSIWPPYKTHSAGGLSTSRTLAFCFCIGYITPDTTLRIAVLTVLSNHKEVWGKAARHHR